MSKRYQIVISPGDGIGHEIIGWAEKVLTAAAEAGGFSLDFIRVDLGLTSYLKIGSAVSEQALDAMRNADATLLVAIAAAEIPKHLPNPIIVFRQELDLYANIRPLKDYARFAPKDRKADLIVLRENTEGFYSGIEYKVGADAACAVRVITKKGSARIAKVGFELARKRRRKLTIVHKVTAHRISDGLFLETVERLGQEEYPDVETERMLVDAAAMHLIRHPMHFDVILATNAYGDILSDEAAEITGGISLAPSANIGDRAAVFEPAHGSAPDLAGKGVANPMATILAAAMMLDHLGEKAASLRVRRGVESVIDAGNVLTPDMGGRSTTSEVGSAIIDSLRNDPL